MIIGTQTFTLRNFLKSGAYVETLSKKNSKHKINITITL